MPTLPRAILVLVGALLLRPLVPGQPALDAGSPGLAELRAQNQELAAELRRQQKLIETLNERLGQLSTTAAAQDQALRALQGGAAPADPGPASAHPGGGGVHLGGTVGLGWFRTGAAGAFPNGEFRVDEAKLFVEAPIWPRVYFFGGLDVVTREANDEYFHVGELYADLEDVSGLWGQKQVLNLRVGRFYLPFGEEYQNRGVLENPLIAHSVADLWGIDEGVEVFGRAGRFDYNLAVQNGGHKTLHDFDSDKSVAVRVGYTPVPWAHLSASALRTGRLSVAGDAMSELWIANGFFRALGSAATTTTFRANVYEVDFAGQWATGSLRAAAGALYYGDNDRVAANARQGHYYSVEGRQQLVAGLYAAARFSHLGVSRGLPLVGLGDFSTYFFRSAPANDLRRLSLGLGYRFGPPLVWKADYSLEGGHLVTGDSRDQENLLSTEIALQF